MDGRGRKSAASLSVISPVSIMRRPEPLPGLSESQRELWYATVAVMPADWWNASNLPLLAEYVRAVDMCGLLAMQIEAAVTDGDQAVLKDALKLRDMESKRSMALATKMRIAQQSTYNALNGNTAKKHAGASAKPWLFGKE